MHSTSFVFGSKVGSRIGFGGNVDGPRGRRGCGSGASRGSEGELWSSGSFGIGRKVSGRCRIALLNVMLCVVVRRSRSRVVESRSVFERARDQHGGART